LQGSVESVPGYPGRLDAGGPATRYPVLTKSAKPECYCIQVTGNRVPLAGTYCYRRFTRATTRCPLLLPKSSLFEVSDWDLEC